MPQLQNRVQQYKSKPPIETSWDNFRGGLNTLLNEIEIQGNELAQADNLLLTGLGIPSKRWGYKSYFMAGATGAVRAIAGYYNGSTNETLALTDYGILTKKSGASYTAITGASWPSGYEATMTQLNNKVYIVSPERELTRYDGSTLVSFSTISTPVISGISNLSGASGIGELTEVSYRVSAEGKVGETLASTALSLASVQGDPLLASIRIVWGAVSAASGDMTGYVVYGREAGRESFMARVDKSTLTYVDNGEDTPSQIIDPPTADTTGGQKAKFVIRYKDKLIMAGIPNDPTKVIFSGRVPNEYKNHWSYGGGFVLIDPDSGDSITGLAVLREKILVFKERSIWELTFGEVKIGNWTLSDPQYQLLTASHGTVSHKSIIAVEDDLFFLTRRGVYAIGYKPNLLNILATTEISAKVRNKFDSMNTNAWNLCSAEYKDFKYIISYPEVGKSYSNKQLIFDRERGAWMGPWTIEASNLFKYYDSNNSERLLFGSNVTPYVFDLSSDYGTDDGKTIATTLRTRKEDFKNWNLYKTMKSVFTQFRDVQGTVGVDIFIEQRTGNIATAKSFSINPTTGNSGWGSFLWGNALWGDSPEDGGGGDLTEIIRWAELNQIGRSIQLQVKTTGSSDTYKLLGIKLSAKVQGKGSIPASYRV